MTRTARARAARALAAATALIMALVGCTSIAEPLPTGAPLDAEADVGPGADFVAAGSSGVTIVDGDDWTLPASVRPAQNSGFFSEETSEDDLVLVHSVDVTWAQL